MTDTVRILTRNPKNYLRDSIYDIVKTPRNTDSRLHKLPSQREYVRATNAAKLERMFAKPFVKNLDVGRDEVTRLQFHPSNVGELLMGSADGRIIEWNLGQDKKTFDLQFHSGRINGLSFISNYQFLSIGEDKSVKLFDRNSLYSNVAVAQSPSSCRPIASDSLDILPLSIDCQFSNERFCIGDNQSIKLYRLGDNQQAEHRSLASSSFHNRKSRFDGVVSESRTLGSTPIKTWIPRGNTASHFVRFNPIEMDLFVALCKDNSLQLYDIRQQNLVNRIKVSHLINAMSWNPLNPNSFVCASNDYNVYSWDVRTLAKPSIIHKAHTNAVLDVNFGPTGAEFASASSDSTIRLWNANEYNSRDYYFTKRMGMVKCVAVSNDNRFIVSSSLDQNVRLWKMKASEKLGSLGNLQRKAMNEEEALRQKYKHHPKVREILKRRNRPIHLKNAAKQNQEMRDKQIRKERNRRINTRREEYVVQSEHEQVVTQTMQDEEEDERARVLQQRDRDDDHDY